MTINGQAQTPTELDSANPNCTSNPDGSLTCIIAVGAPAGADHFDASLYDAPGGQGNVLARGSKDANLVVFPASIDLEMKGVIATFALSLSGLTSPACGDSKSFVAPGTSLPLGVKAFDADGNLIDSGEYFNQIALKSSDTTTDTTLSANTLISPLDNVTLKYLGGAIRTLSLSASADGASGNPSSVTLTPSVVDRPLVPTSILHYEGVEMATDTEIPGEQNAQTTIPLDYDDTISTVNSTNAPDNVGSAPLNACVEADIGIFAPGSVTLGTRIFVPAPPFTDSVPFADGLVYSSAPSSQPSYTGTPGNVFSINDQGGRATLLEYYDAYSKLTFDSPRIIATFPSGSGSGLSSSVARHDSNPNTSTATFSVDASGLITDYFGLEDGLPNTYVEKTGGETWNLQDMGLSALPAACPPTIAFNGLADHMHLDATGSYGSLLYSIDGRSPQEQDFVPPSSFERIEDEYSVPGLGFVCRVETYTYSNTHQDQPNVGDYNSYVDAYGTDTFVASLQPVTGDTPMFLKWKSQQRFSSTTPNVVHRRSPLTGKLDKWRALRHN